MARIGYPTEMTLNTGEYQYLEFYNTHGEFRVILNKAYGSGVILINAINSSLDFIDQIPSTTKTAQWSTLENKRDTYIS